MVKKYLGKFALIWIGIITLYAMFLIENRDIVYNVQITSDGLSESINSWYDEESKNNYIFLPSYAGENTLTYDEEIASKDNVVFVRSANVSTIYITTATGSMDSVYEDKSHKEPVSVIIYSEDGKLEYQCDSARIKGHGSSSWNLDKKPFKLIFDEKISLDGLGEGTEWILQANAYDQTNLRNALVMDTAKNLGIEEVSDYKYVDVYLNGEYNGLYTLVQSVQDTLTDTIGEENIYLAAADTSGEVWDESGNYFRINDFASAELKLPETISEEGLSEIENNFQKADAVITGETAGEIEDYIDIDSWTRKYLIDEIFENFDSGVRSNYMYWISDDENGIRIKAGPLWDYDNSFGAAGETIEDPNILYASQFQRSSAINILWYGYLYNNSEFYNSIVQKYRDEFRDVLVQMAGGGISDLADQIQPAVAANNVRWKVTESESASELISWLKSRIEFLDSIWLEEEPYVMVTIDPGGVYEYIRCFIREGDCLKDNPMFESYFGDADSEWRNAETKEEIDFSAPVYNDMTVINVHSDTDSIVTKLYNNKDSLFALISIALLGAGVLILLALDIRKNGFEEGNCLWKKKND